MKHIITIYLIFFSVCCYSQTQDTLIYYDDYIPEVDYSSSLQIPSKTTLLRADKGGNIVTNYTGNIPDSLIYGINKAIGIWQNYIQPNDTIKIDIKYNNTKDNDIVTNVYYTRIAQGNESVAYPYSLCRKKGWGSYSTDAEVIINSDVNWQCDYANIQNKSVHNITYAFLRALAHTMGFGSSIHKNKYGRIALKIANSKSVFDRLIVSSDGHLLKNCSSSEIGPFAQSEFGQVYVSCNNQNIGLYAPSIFEEYYSLKYLTDPNSLMYYNGNSSNRILYMDSKTSQLLNAIGWDLRNRTNQIIKCDDIDSTGIASSYVSHSFYLDGDDGSSSNTYSWTFMVKKEDGFSTLYSSDQSVFTIPSINNQNDYVHSIYGDIQGRVLFQGNINGINVTDTMSVYLELKPNIYEANVIRTAYNNDGDYVDIDLAVKYEGSNRLIIHVEEENSFGAQRFFVEEPFFAHVRARNLDAYGDVWINIIALNDYGQTTRTVYFPCSEHINDTKERAVTGVSLLHNQDRKKIVVYNANGVLLEEISDFDNLSSLNIPSGLYIIKYYENGVFYKTTKYVKE